ncbi:MAG: hypothetical protein ACE5OS_01900 [Anaerolineae bacterium]
MVRHLIRVTGVLVTLTLLLAVVAGAARCGEAGRGANEASSTIGSVERTDDTPLVCLALVGGAALLAGGVWMGQMRRMLT